MKLVTFYKIVNQLIQVPNNELINLINPPHTATTWGHPYHYNPSQVYLLHPILVGESKGSY